VLDQVRRARLVVPVPLLISADVWRFSGDFLRSITSAPKALPELLPAFVSYALVLALFGGFVVWNGGIVLGVCFS
jgi:alpha-1,2-glucosyltransferase